MKGSERSELNEILHGDCLHWLRELPSDSIDFVFCSPPYEGARDYGIGFKLAGQDWVDWALPRFIECVRVCRGLVAWVVEGRTAKFRYSATPALLMADLVRSKIRLRKPGVFHRVGIAGSGGPDYLRNDWEFIICASKGRLPWSDNTAMGHPPKYAPGGAMSHRLTNGERRNQWGGTDHPSSMQGREVNGARKKAYRKNHELKTPSQAEREAGADGAGSYVPPVLANPGNVWKFAVGGGVMGDRLCHQNEAPFPEGLAEAYIRSFCKPGGVVLDPFCGSGTTLAVAERLGRRWIGMEVRQSQVDLSTRRIANVRKESNAASATAKRSAEPRNRS